MLRMYSRLGSHASGMPVGISRQETTFDRQPDDYGGLRGRAPGAAPAGPASASRRRVLIVEDNETARKQIQVFLETDPGLGVDTAANGSDALKALTERPYSVIVTDLKMPRVDGLQLLEEVQKRRLPADVIITTGFGTIDARRAGDAAWGPSTSSPSRSTSSTCGW